MPPYLSAMRPALVAAVLASLLLGPVAWATDQPVDAARLVLKRSGARETLAFRTRDARFLFPALGGADDPATATPGGLTIELFSQSEGIAALLVPAGEGRPGWTKRAGVVGSYRFVNRAAPDGPSVVRSAVLREGRMLKIVARGTGLALAAPQGAVGIRITTGGLRTCALFDGPTIRRDHAGAFVARHASAAVLADCSDAALGGAACSDGVFPDCGGACPVGSVCSTQDLATCTCISSASPCDATAPVCNGQCPAGEACRTFGPSPFSTCACLPEGATPCGDPGFPACGGACPGADVCRPAAVPGPAGGDVCICAAPAPCDASCGGADCPAGLYCAIVPGPGCLCVPLP